MKKLLIVALFAVVGVSSTANAFFGRGGRCCGRRTYSSCNTNRCVRSCGSCNTCR